MTYRFLTTALLEISEAAEFYNHRSTEVGADFFDELDDAIQRILQFPEAWGRISKEFRHCHFRRFPYSIIYTIEDEIGILVISVFHQSREPLSWQENL